MCSCFWPTCVVGLLLALPSSLLAAPDSQGKEFILGFMENKAWLRTRANRIELFITTVSKTPVKVVVTTPLYDPTWNATVTVSKGTLEVVKIPLGIRGKKTEKSNKGVHVKASGEISVYSVNKEQKSTDAYISLPVDVLGREYYAMTYITDAELLVVGTEDNTTVNITWPTGAGPTRIHFKGVTYRNGDTLVVSLDKFQTFHALQKTKTADFTGAHIKSDKPVSFFSGNLKVAVPVNGDSMDHLTEMLTPVETWGKSFITTSTPDRSIGDLFRIMASENDTHVQLGSGTSYSISKAGDFVEIDLPTGDYQVVTSDKPVMIAMFSKTWNSDGPNYGDPAMSLIIPEPQYASDYTWSSVKDPTGAEFYNKVSVIIDKDKVSGLLLDDEPVTWEENVEIPNSGGKTHLWTRVTPGSHNLYHVDPTVTFMALVSGTFRVNSYAYLAGLRMATINAECSGNVLPVPGDIIDNDCDGKVDEEAFNGIDDDGDGKVDEDLATLPKGSKSCQVAGDPHLLDFQRHQTSLPVPCAYRVAILRVHNFVHKTGSPYFPLIEVEITASNGYPSTRGRYFVAHVSVRVTLFSTENSRRVDGPSGTYTTGYSQIHDLLSGPTLPEGDAVWTSEVKGDLQGRVKLTYDADNNLAELTIEGASPRVQFRFADPSGGLVQRPLPGVFIEVGSDQIAEDDAMFPNTLCSSPDDTKSLRKHARAAGLARVSVLGVHAVLDQGLPQTLGDQPDQCNDAMTVYAGCSNRTSALTQCSPLTEDYYLVKCLDKVVSGAGSFGAFVDCLSFTCRDDAAACRSLKTYADDCPHITNHVQLAC